MKRFAIVIILFFPFRLIAWGQEVYVSKDQTAVKIDIKQTFELKAESGKFYFVQDGDKTELFPQSETVFFTDPKTDDIFEFIFDEKTKAYTLFLTVEGGIRLEAIRSN